MEEGIVYVLADDKIFVGDLRKAMLVLLGATKADEPTAFQENSETRREAVEREYFMASSWYVYEQE
jgi:hypothetical protein